MKKIIFVLLIIFIFVSLSIQSYSYENTDEIWEVIDDETKEYLYDLGIEELSFDELFEINPTRIINFLFDLAFNKGTNVVDKFVVIFVVLIITAIASSFLKESNNLNNIIDYICILIVLSFVMESVSRILTDAATGIKNSTIFMNTYLPVITGMIVATKNPSLALTYNSFSIFLSNLISVFSDKILVPLISVMFSFNVVCSFSSGNIQLRIVSTIRRLVVVVLSLFSTVYTGLLTTQSILASSTDSIALKGIKFVSGTFIPIVGGNVGDAVSSVLSSFLIMKNTLGVFVIIVIILINLPAMIEMLIWYFLFGLCSIVSSLLNLDNITNILDSLSSTVALLNIILFFITFVLVISTGIIIVMGKQ